MIAICNWERWQTFRKDRGSPPWIKLHRCVLTNPEWAMLSDCEKGQLISMWIVAADKNGELPTDDPKMLRKICLLDDTPNIGKFKELGFLTTMCQPLDNQASPKCPQDDAPEQSRGEKRREEERETEFEIPLKNGSFFSPSLSDVDGWVKQYPNLSIKTELLKLIEWNNNNKTKRKTKKGIKKHITSWLSNAQPTKVDNQLPPEILT